MDTNKLIVDGQYSCRHTGDEDLSHLLSRFVTYIACCFYQWLRHSHTQHSETFHETSSGAVLKEAHALKNPL